MNMNLKIPAGLLRATRLVRAGKLMEATAAIQRALKRGAPLSAAPSNHADAAVIEGTFRAVDADLLPFAQQREAVNDLNFGATAPAAEKGGRFITGSFTNRAGTRLYKTYIPALYHGQALPLVVMLHGCKQGPDDFAAGTRMNVLSEEHGFVVVYPAQAREANASNCWNWFQAGDQRRDEGEPSLIAGITREVVASYGLDARRIYVAGLSAGGAMAVILGTTYPDLFAAIGIHSGLAYAAAGDLPSAFAAMRGEGRPRGGKRASRGDLSHRAVPTIVFHGDRDTTVHPSNGERVIAQSAMPAAGAKSSSTPYRATVENGRAGGRKYTRTTHRDNAGKPIMEHWVVHGAGHAWSGGSTNGSYTDARGPDASREMLRFFLQYPEPPAP